MRCHMYLRKDKVFIPTFGRVPGGPCRDIEPVAVVEVSDAEVCAEHSARRSQEVIRQLVHTRALIRRRSSSSMPASRPGGRLRAARCPGVSRRRTESFKSSVVAELRMGGWTMPSNWSDSRRAPRSVR
jgi:hypothetical protein